MSNSNSKKKQTDGLTPVKTHICNDGDDGDMSFMGSPPLLPFDDPTEYKKLRQAASNSMTADFLGQFWCASKARVTSGGGFRPESCRLIW